MSKLNLETFRIDSTNSDPFRIYLNPDNLDFIEASLIVRGNQITNVKIIDSKEKREFKRIIYCPQFDSIEVHCLVGPNINPNLGFNENISNCRLDCLRFMIFEYEDERKLKTCHENYYQPDTKKGNIIVGNP